MEWWKTFFDEDYLAIYGLGLPEAPGQVDFIERVLSLDPPKYVLDLCCGHGRYAIGLAHRRPTVIAQNPSPSIIVIIITETFTRTIQGLGHRRFGPQPSYRVSERYAAIIITGSVSYGFNKPFLSIEPRLVHLSGR